MTFLPYLNSNAYSYLEELKNDLKIPTFKPNKISTTNYTSWLGKKQINKDITILSRPIELQAVETFTITINIPTKYVEVKASDLFKFDEDYFITKDKLCHCDSQTLFRSGCQCGGV